MSPEDKKKFESLVKEQIQEFGLSAFLQTMSVIVDEQADEMSDMRLKDRAIDFKTYAEWIWELSTDIDD